MVAVSLFVISMSTILFFFGSNIEKDQPQELKTSVMESFDIKSLQDQENSYRTMLKNNEDSIIVLNGDGTIDFTSWDIETGLGYNQNEMKTQIFFLYLNPDDLSLFLGAFGKVIDTQKPMHMVGPYRLRSKDGGYHLVIGNLTPVIEGDKVTKIVVSTKDITKQMSDAADKKKTEEDQAPKGKKIRNQSEKETDPVKLIADKIAG